MKILEALEKENIRLSNGDKWLIIDEGEFIVHQKKNGKKTVKTVYKGTSEEEAIKNLLS